MKFDKIVVQRICEYIREGDSQKLAAKKAGIAEDTFYRWLKNKQGFSEEIKKAKDEFLATITGKLEATLWKRAMGYEVTETETEYLPDEDGKPKIKSQKTKIKHIQPDTGALIFALTNVAPDKWINRQKVETQEVKKEQEQDKRYCFEDLPEDALFEIADKLQDQEYKKTMEQKHGKAENEQ